ncbi:MFS multidrug transporter [Thozetella sp. PMI_491]|nr:MFS multidrug transporter [Thozetella sp. PMI_491]
MVRWRPDSKWHPRQWGLGRKCFDTSLIIFLDFFTTAVSTAGAPVGEHAKGQFGISPITATLVFVSTYLFGQGIGSIVFPPYSESFGRKKLYATSAALYSVFCVVVALSPSIAGVAIGRFMTGFLSAIPSIVVAGSIEDLWNAHARVWLIFIWALAGNIGLIIGPILGNYIIASLGWQWVFYIAAVVTAITSILLLGIRESRPSLILRRRVEDIRAATGDNILTTSSPDHMPDLQTFAREALFRPIGLFFTDLIVFAVAFMSSVAIALIYLFTEAIPLIYSSYNLSDGQKIIPFVTLGVGLVCGVFTRCYDHYFLRSRKIRGEDIAPEDKLLGFSIGAPLLAVGLWWFAWTIPPAAQLSWVVPTVPLVLVGYAITEFDVVLAGYMADSYLSYAASGFGALAMLRSLLSAIFPLFAKRMFQDLGNNMAGTVLAVLATIFCVVPPLFTRYGEMIRKRSRFASYSLALQEEC